MKATSEVISKASARQLRPAGLSERDLVALRDELDTLKREFTAKIGDDDVKYGVAVMEAGKLSEVIGRLCVHFSLDPITYGVGILALANYYSSMAALGHSVGHRCYQRLDGGEALRADNVPRRTGPIPVEVWAKGHALHHAHTDNMEMDPDLCQAPKSMRLGAHFPWTPAHLLQPPVLMIGAVTALWFQAAYYNGLLDPMKERKLRHFMKDPTPATYWAAVKRFVTDAAPHVAVDYVLYPALAGPFFGKVLFANVTAELIANAWIALVSLGTHYGAGDDLEFHAKRPGSKAEWYLGQILGTTDVKLPMLLTHQCVELNLHVAHHLFPSMPPNRLIGMTPRIKEICARYGLRFREHTTWETTKNVLKRVVRYSLPDSLGDRLRARWAGRITRAGAPPL